MDAAFFYDRVWAAIRDKYRSEVRRGRGRDVVPAPAAPAPPLGASQRHCLQLWHGATLASWVAPPPLQKPPRPQLSAPPSLSLGSSEGVETQGRPWAMVGAWPPALGVGVDPESSARPLRISGRCCPQSTHHRLLHLM